MCPDPLDQLLAGADQVESPRLRAWLQKLRKAKEEDGLGTVPAQPTSEGEDRKEKCQG